MLMHTTPAGSSLHTRAIASRGISAEAIYRTVAAIIRQRHRRGGLLLDVGCGTGSLLPFVSQFVDEYRGADAVRYDTFPAEQEFIQVDLDSQHWPIADNL